MQRPAEKEIIWLGRHTTDRFYTTRSSKGTQQKQKQKRYKLCFRERPTNSPSQKKRENNPRKRNDIDTERRNKISALASKEAIK